jgi:hypothetical protein
MVVGLTCSQTCPLVGDVRRIETLGSAARVINPLKPFRDCFTYPLFHLKLIKLLTSLELSMGRGCRYVYGKVVPVHYAMKAYVGVEI